MTTSAVTPVARVRPPEAGTERETLTGLLDFLRATVVNKVAGLTDEQAFGRPVPPSTLTPAGVVKHLAGVERFWFSVDFAGADVPWPWSDDDPHGNFPIAEGDTLARIVAEYLDECERSRQAIAGAGLDDPARGQDMTFNLRYALAHMIEETAATAATSTCSANASTAPPANNGKRQVGQPGETVRRPACLAAVTSRAS